MSGTYALDFGSLRSRMVDEQIAARGIRDRRVLDAFCSVPREAFVPSGLEEFAYDDAPLPIGEEQTISQPYIVALMCEALELRPSDRVLEVGTGSGYAAAILSRLAAEAYTVERLEGLAERARRRLQEAGFRNVHVRHGDGTLGWPEHAPYDAIVVAAGGPRISRPLLDQLAVDGRLVMPVGPSLREQHLVRVTRVSDTEFRREDLGPVRFVPLIGAGGWPEPPAEPAFVASSQSPCHAISKLIREVAEPISSIEDTSLEHLLDRIGDSRIVLLGEATHGTSEFYRMRARITRELIERRGFDIVAVEADWPDAARVDAYVRHLAPPSQVSKPFSRFPTWMWRNAEVREFTDWLRTWNSRKGHDHQVSFHGLDLYSLHASIDAVLQYLERVDPEAARIARMRYGCLTPWQADPATYGKAAVTGRYRSCEGDVVAMLKDLLERRLDYASRDGERYLDAVQNARLVANGERYYRTMYYGSRESWNLRDRHMFGTLELLLSHHGEGSKAVVWEHNSHLGDARATEMGARGELNVGQLVRERHGEQAYLVGFGTDHGTVAAAHDWGGEMEVMNVVPARPESYERLSHDSGREAFLLHLRDPKRRDLRDELIPPRLERAIGVIYRPETELLSHYFQASLPLQFDEWIWFDTTRAVTPFASEPEAGLPDTYPFGV